MSVPLTAVAAMRTAMIEASFLLRDDVNQRHVVLLPYAVLAERLRSARRLRWLAGVGGLPS